MEEIQRQRIMEKEQEVCPHLNPTHTPSLSRSLSLSLTPPPSLNPSD